MKNLFFGLIAVFTLSMIGCSDPCDDVNCGPGVCVEGTCDCPDGYEGESCETTIRDRFIGTWNSTDFSCDGEAPEEVTFIISAGDAITEVTVTDPEQPEIEITAIVDGNSFTIPSQNITLDFGIVVNITGSGSIANGVIDLMIVQEVPGFGSAICGGTLSM